MENGEIDESKVNYNEYSWTLPQLIRFIRETQELVVDIVEIRPEDTGTEDSSGTRRGA